MEAITPPKDDEIETPQDELETPPEPTDSVEPSAIFDGPKEKTNDEQETRLDEIVVEPEGKGSPIGNGEGEANSLSSAPPSDDDDEEPSETVKATKAKASKPAGAKCDKIGEVAGVKERLDKRRGDDDLLKTLHRILYKRPGTAHEVKKNIREFSGFHFADDAVRQGVHDRLSKLTMAQLKEICALLGLPVSGAKEAVVDALLDMLDQPWDTKKAYKTKRRRSSGKVPKPLTKKKSSDNVKAPKKRKAPSPEQSEDQESVSEDEEPPKKKRKALPPKKGASKLSDVKVRSVSPDVSSDDDKPLRPAAPSDVDLKSAIKEFLQGKDLSTVTKGMVKEALRTKYGEALVKTKKAVIAEGIEEGMLEQD